MTTKKRISLFILFFLGIAVVFLVLSISYKVLMSEPESVKIQGSGVGIEMDLYEKQ